MSKFNSMAKPSGFHPWKHSVSTSRPRRPSNMEEIAYVVSQIQYQVFLVSGLLYRRCGLLLRYSSEKVLFHRRKSFSGITLNIQADLLTLSWFAATILDVKMRKVMFEFRRYVSGGALDNPLTHPFAYYTCHGINSKDFLFDSRRQSPPGLRAL